MRYPAEHKQQTRERIVKAAARRFRRRGSEGAGIGELMRDLRLTHGGFYRHFGSKEELVAEAFELSLGDIRRRFAAGLAKAPAAKRLEVLIDAYLGVDHCADPAGGCPLAALGPELARRPQSARTGFQRALDDHLKLISTHLPGTTDEERERKAMVLFSGMAGTLAAARLMADEGRRRRLLDDARKFYLQAALR